MNMSTQYLLSTASLSFNICENEDFPCNDNESDTTKDYFEFQETEGLIENE